MGQSLRVKGTYTLTGFLTEDGVLGVQTKIDGVRLSASEVAGIMASLTRTVEIQMAKYKEGLTLEDRMAFNGQYDLTYSSMSKEEECQLEKNKPKITPG